MSLRNYDSKEAGASTEAKSQPKTPYSVPEQPASDTLELREKLAAIEHERWADWQKWVHKKLKPHDDPMRQDFVLTSELYEAWEKQINTPYDQLSEAEKKSDMEQVDRYWPLLTQWSNNRLLAELETLIAEFESEFERIKTELGTSFMGSPNTMYHQIVRDRIAELRGKDD